jgi:hypothetical protein
MATRPVAVAADGNIKIAWCTSLTVAAPTTTQLNAGTDLSFYLAADGFTTTVSEQTITDDRLADIQTFENKGRVQYSVDNLRYVYNLTSRAGQRGVQRAHPERAGLAGGPLPAPAGTAWTSGQKVDVWPVILGEQQKEPPAANAVLHVVQKPFVIGSVVKDAVIA